jgi:transcriptional regulator
MYIPAAFNEPDLNTLHAFIERFSFGQLVSQVDGQPFATHLPFLVDREAGSKGALIGHTARANPQCHAASDQTVLAIFSGPHAYISPSWYESENVVPTWNYVAVHVYGKLRKIDDVSVLRDLVQKLTAYNERAMPQPWNFDGHSSFAERMLSQIVGFRIEIESIEGKWKLSQNHPVERQQKVVNALKQRSDENSQDVATLMQAKLMQRE